MRSRLPDAQRKPLPNTAGFERLALPWSKTESEFGSSPVVSIVTVSGVVVPEAPSSAPLGFCEFAQPLPAAPKFKHGQLGEVVPSPKQYDVPTETPPPG